MPEINRNNSTEKTEEALRRFFEEKENSVVIPGKDRIKAFSDIKTADASGKTKRPARFGWIYAAAAVLFAAVALVFVIRAAGRTLLPSPVTSTVGTGDAPVTATVYDRVYSASPVEAEKAWESAGGLTVLSLVSEKPNNGISGVSFPFLRSLGNGPDASSTSVNVSFLAGAKVSRSLSGRFINLTHKSDAQTGFDTKKFGSFDGVYFDLATGKLFCIGYEAAKVINAEREDETERIFMMLASSLFFADDKASPEVFEKINAMREEYTEKREIYYDGYEGWQALCEKYEDVSKRDFLLTPDEKSLLHAFFLDGDADLSVFDGEKLVGTDQARHDLGVFRMVALTDGFSFTDGFSDIEVVEFGACEDKALVKIAVRGVQKDNPWQPRVSLAVFDMKNGTLNTINDPENFGDIVTRRGDVLTDSAYTRFAFLYYGADGKTAAVYDVNGSEDRVSFAKKPQGDPEPCGAEGELFVSPGERYGYFLKARYGEEGEKWVVFPFSAGGYPNADGTDASVGGQTASGGAYVFEGEFVRFARDDSAVIMKTESGYRAYSAQTGEDVTDFIFEGLGENGGEEGNEEDIPELKLAAHEYYRVTEDESGLYRTDIVTGERTLIAPVGSYDAYTQDAEKSCVYILSLKEECVKAVPVVSCMAEYVIRIDGSFVAEAKNGTEISIRLADRGATLIVSSYNRGDIKFDEAVFIEKLNEERKFGDAGTGLADNYNSTFVPSFVLGSIKYGDVYLHIEEEDINITYVPLEYIGRYIVLDKIKEAVADDMLISWDEMLDISRYAAERIIDYIDIDTDGAVRLAGGVMEKLFGAELNPGDGFIRNEYVPFIREWGADANPDLFKKFAEVNVKNELALLGKNAPLSGEKLGAFIAAVAARLEEAYEKHYSSEYQMYVQISEGDLLAMKNAVRNMTRGYAAAFAADSRKGAELINGYSLPDFSKSFREWTDEEKRAAGLID